MTSKTQSSYSEVSNSYDETPYVSQSFPKSHPSHLAATAMLFGLNPPDIRYARILELGCAAGGNLLPIACTWPNSKCVGVDLSVRQIMEGRAIVSNLGLDNCELRHASIIDVDSDWGQFDYIICHGVWSWVSEDVRSHIFQVCQNNLTENGVAYISYNTYPGWHMRGAIRDLMRWHTEKFMDPTQKVQQARAVLQFLCDSVPSEGDAYGLMLRNEAKILDQHADYYILHDHLEEVNHPVYVHDFLAQCANANLEYLAEAELGSMLPLGLSQNTAEILRHIAPDIVQMEQYLDFLRNRTFRQTLLVHSGKAINRNLTPASLENLYFASPLRAASGEDQSMHGSTRFVLPNGNWIDTTGTITKAALLIMEKAWPQPLNFSRILNEATHHTKRVLAEQTTLSDQTSLVQELGTDLLQLLLNGFIESWSEAHPLTIKASSQPIGYSLARYQAKNIPVGSDGRITNIRGESVGLDAVSIRILELLNGENDRPKIIKTLERFFADGELSIQRDGELVSDPILLRGMLVTITDDSIRRLAEAGLLQS